MTEQYAHSVVITRTGQAANQDVRLDHLDRRKIAKALRITPAEVLADPDESAG